MCSIWMAYESAPPLHRISVTSAALPPDDIPPPRLCGTLWKLGWFLLIQLRLLRVQTALRLMSTTTKLVAIWVLVSLPRALLGTALVGCL